MIKNLLVTVALAVIFAACGSSGLKDKAQEESSATEASDSLVPLIVLGEFEAKAGDFVDKEIIVEGIVDHICKHGAKRMRLVSDEGELHVDSENPFEESLVGSHVVINGIVREFRVDEAYCLKMEEDNIQSHKEGKTDDEQYAQKMEHIKNYRDSMAAANVDHLSFYSLDLVSIETKEDDL